MITNIKLKKLLKNQKTRYKKGQEVRHVTTNNIGTIIEVGRFKGNGYYYNYGWNVLYNVKFKSGISLGLTAKELKIKK